MDFCDIRDDNDPPHHHQEDGGGRQQGSPDGDDDDVCVHDDIHIMMKCLFVCNKKSSLP